MGRVGRSHVARAFVAVERERIGAEVFAPERIVEALAQAIGACVPVARAEIVSHLGELRGATPCRIRVSLHLAERDWRRGEPPVSMKYRIVRVLPALLHQPIRAVPRVFEEAVAVAVSIALHPR